MADETERAMSAPLPGVTYCTRMGVPYRQDADGFVNVKAEDVVEMTALGFVALTAQQMGADNPGAPLVDDQGWPIAN